MLDVMALAAFVGMLLLVTFVLLNAGFLFGGVAVTQNEKALGWSALTASSLVFFVACL
jgi:hypothetical protein